MVSNNPTTFFDIAGLMPKKSAGKGFSHWTKKRTKEAGNKFDKATGFLDPVVNKMDKVTRHVKHHGLLPKKRPSDDEDTPLILADELADNSHQPETTMVTAPAEVVSAIEIDPELNGERVALFEDMETNAETRMQSLAGKKSGYIQKYGIDGLLHAKNVVDRMASKNGGSYERRTMRSLSAVRREAADYVWSQKFIDDGGDPNYTDTTPIDIMNDVIFLVQKPEDIQRARAASARRDDQQPLLGNSSATKPAIGLWAWLKTLFSNLWQRIKNMFSSGPAYHHV
jgi:hypothetical protein